MGRTVSASGTIRVEPSTTWIFRGQSVRRGLADDEIPGTLHRCRCDGCNQVRAQYRYEERLSDEELASLAERAARDRREAEERQRWAEERRQEQQQRYERLENERRVRREEYQRQQEEANARAMTLLFSLLPKREQRRVQEHQRFVVKGSEGSQFVVRTDSTVHNVYQKRTTATGEEYWVEMCGLPEWDLNGERLPNADIHVGQLLALRFSEPNFLRAANVGGRVRKPSYISR